MSARPFTREETEWTRTTYTVAGYDKAGRAYVWTPERGVPEPTRSDC
jgi:hypothetical protein